MNQEDIHVQMRSRWPQVLMAAGVDPDILDGNHHPCPVCGGTDRFRFDNKNDTGSWTCSGHSIRPGKICGAGKGIDLLIDLMEQKGMGRKFADAVKYARELAGILPSDGTHNTAASNVVAMPFAGSKNEAKDIEKNRRKLSQMWRDAGTDLDLLKTYLKSRGLAKILDDMPTLPLRVHKRLDFYAKKKGDDRAKSIGRFPTLLAWFQDPNGKVVAIHRTFLAKDGNGKAPVFLNTTAKMVEVFTPERLVKTDKSTLVNKAKKMTETCGSITGGAIRLYDTTGSDILCVTEGVETALAVRLLTNGKPVWANYSAGVMARFEPPPGIKEVWIFADHDKADEQGRRAGIKAANDLQEHLKSKSIKVRKFLPPTEGDDWLDEYLARTNQKTRVAA